MADQLTHQQKMAVENRGGKLLVSAAAGSGKTKVLVDRLLLYISEGKGKINIDDFLIITYTKAAASELRGKIAAKLNERLAEDPGNKHLQRQLQRLYLTKISTVHAFCADILREYAYRLDIPCDFRVAEERECQLLQLQILDKLMNRAYEESDQEFVAFIDSHEYGRDDRSIPQIILQVYHAAQCHIDPDQWLDKCLQAGDVSGFQDVSETVWGKFLLDDFHEFLSLQIQAMETCAALADSNGTMPKSAALLTDNVNALKQLNSLESWDDIVDGCNLDLGRLNFPNKSTDLVLIDRIKAVRDGCKEALKKKRKPFADKSDQVLRDLQNCAAATRGLVSLVRQFTKEYDALKKSRRILDFSDLEHKTLDLLIGRNRQMVTSLAYEIGSRFCEIMVDEYQDSNAVQDSIFAALTEKKQNCFMVGDVKQSIYQFRLADPKIFLDKYNHYVPAENAKDGQGRKIMLSSNFRSAAPVIDAVNDVFKACMSPEVGDLVYGEEEMLREGVPHISVPETEIELCCIDVQQDTYAEEASYTADRIVSLLDGSHYVRNGDSLRPIVADDIAILLRSPGSVGAEFQYALESRGIRVNSGNGIDLLQTEEIGFLRAFLQVIDNPLQDIPLIATLSSKVFCFTADDLAVIRASGSRKKTVYDSLKASDSVKAKEFLIMLRQLREESRLCSLSQLIDKILISTKMDSIFSAFEDGDVRKSNLQAFYQLILEYELSNQRELGQFLDYLSSMEEKGLTLSAEQMNTGAVTIMSIHKSKGLEFPVVFLCGLSRDFNREDSRAQVLCHKELGIGMSCVDLANRVRYPSIAKKAIAAKILSDGQSEEMRVLYVAMTRARDRLIMTYASNTLASDLQNLVNRMDLCDPIVLTSEASCPGTWVLMTALRRMESGALFTLAEGRPDNLQLSDTPWRVCVEKAIISDKAAECESEFYHNSAVSIDISKLRDSLNYVYPHMAATSFPSKQTATQLKGRMKDQEAAENTEPPKHYVRNWREAVFVQPSKESAISFGNTIHTIMQYIKYEKCVDLSSVEEQLEQLVKTGLISKDSFQVIDPVMLWNFFDSDMGKKIRNASQVIREFKFSILEDGSNFDQELLNDQILLQGVVDCAIIESDGITVIDFKTDKVTEITLTQVTDQYRMQVQTYAQALSRIYKKEIKSAQLYFFRINRFVSVI